MEAEMAEVIEKSPLSSVEDSGGMVGLLLQLCMWALSAFAHLLYLFYSLCSRLILALAAIHWIVKYALCVMIFAALFQFQRFVRRKLLRERLRHKDETKPSLRKRDTVLNFSKSVVRSSASLLAGGGLTKVKRKKKDRKTALKALQNLRYAEAPLSAFSEPPSAFFEASSKKISADVSEAGLPPEVIFVLRYCRMFGHFEQKIFKEIFKSTETKQIEKDAIVLQPGQADDRIYVVVEGELELHMKDLDTGEQYFVRTLRVGDSLTSLLSVLDVIVGNSSVVKTVTVKAVQPSNLAVIPSSCFLNIFEKHPDSLSNIVRIILTRLQRVTFLSLYKFFGLTHNLIVSRKESEEKGSSPHRSKLRRTKGLVTTDKGNHSSLLTAAAGDIAELFAIDSKEIEACIKLENFFANSKVISQGMHDSGVYFLIEGKMDVYLRNADDGEDQFLFTVGEGGMVGHLGVLSGDPSLMTVVAKETTLAAKISKVDFEKMAKANPAFLLNCARDLVGQLSPFVRQVDFGLDWVNVLAGTGIYTQNEKSDSIYIILNGRVRSVVKVAATGKKEFVEEYGRGEPIGDVEILKGCPRKTSVHAIRDTEMIRIPVGLFQMINHKFPKVSMHLNSRIGERVLSSLESGGSKQKFDYGANKNVATVAIVGVSKKVPTTRFAVELSHAINHIGPCKLLTWETVEDAMNVDTPSASEFKLLRWLEEQEENHRIVLYLCDYECTSWTNRCIRQADIVLLVGLGDGDPLERSPVELHWDSFENLAQKELVLLHSMKTDSPKGTIDWLNCREWCSSHHHVRLNQDVLTDIHNLGGKFRHQKPNAHMTDMARLARRLTGTSIGVVLGGGGARGISHLGVLKALETFNIPVDMIGGTSMGSFIGALYAEETDVEKCIRRSQSFAVEMGNNVKKIWDLTYPVTAMFKGAAFNTLIKLTFGETKQIEDLWLPYYCITTDISHYKERVHRHGCLWRYVRGSMSLSGFLPPICDPIDGHMLLDGGYVNNVPADVMKGNGAQTVIAVDVSSADEMNLHDFGDELSGWWLIWNKWNPFQTTVKVPTMGEIQDRLAYLGNVRQMEALKASDDIQYLRPPIEQYGTLQFKSHKDIYETGFKYGKAIVQDWIDNGLTLNLLLDRNGTRYYLADLVCDPHQTVRTLKSSVSLSGSKTDLRDVLSEEGTPNRERKFSI
eukprot:Nk52_evm55s78 gene=Nk52_evmTU55s78